MGLAQPDRPSAGGLRTVGYLAVAVFVVLLGTSMVLYPEGTWTDRTTTSYRFFENFFCDSTHAHGLNGMPNPGAPYAKAALVAMAPALVLFFVCLARTLVARPGRARAVHALGILSGVALVFVPFTPSDTFGALHAVPSLTASCSGLLALLLFLSAAWREPGAGRAFAMGVVLLLIASVDVALYVHQVRTNGPTPLALPALQKVAAAWLLGWMLVLFRQLR